MGWYEFRGAETKLYITTLDIFFTLDICSQAMYPHTMGPIISNKLTFPKAWYKKTNMVGHHKVT